MVAPAVGIEYRDVIYSNVGLQIDLPPGIRTPGNPSRAQQAVVTPTGAEVGTARGGGLVQSVVDGSAAGQGCQEAQSGQGQGQVTAKCHYVSFNSMGSYIHLRISFCTCNQRGENASLHAVSSASIWRRHPLARRQGATCRTVSRWHGTGLRGLRVSTSRTASIAGYYRREPRGRSPLSPSTPSRRRRVCGRESPGGTHGRAAARTR